MNKLFVIIILAFTVSMTANAGGLADRFNEARSFPAQAQSPEGRTTELKMEHIKMHEMHDEIHVRHENFHAKMHVPTKNAKNRSHHER